MPPLSRQVGGGEGWPGLATWALWDRPSLFRAALFQHGGAPRALAAASALKILPPITPRDVADAARWMQRHHLRKSQQRRIGRDRAPGPEATLPALQSSPGRRPPSRKRPRCQTHLRFQWRVCLEQPHIIDVFLRDRRPPFPGRRPSAWGVLKGGEGRMHWATPTWPGSWTGSSCGRLTLPAESGLISCSGWRFLGRRDFWALRAVGRPARSAPIRQPARQWHPKSARGR
jgi:hypothetical protein